MSFTGYRGAVMETTAQPAEVPAGDERGGAGSFHVHLDVFDGPFDLLLGLISKHKLDVTEVALSQVTDDFLAHTRRVGAEWDLGVATEFLVVAATLLDLKAARLLPSGEVDDEDDLALLEARDLLFARLLQYKAYKEVAGVLAARMSAEALRFPRSVGPDEPFTRLLPDVLLGLRPQEFAALAGRALTPRPVPVVGLGHLHAPRVSVREQAAVIVERLRMMGAASFRGLTRDAEDIQVVVARFLAVLELYREGAVAFEQADPLGELLIRWVGRPGADLDVGAEFDEDDHADMPPAGSVDAAEPEGDTEP